MSQSQSPITDETFGLIGRDALAWLDHAKELKMSANLILNELLSALSMSPTLPGVREKQLAYTHSFMLLTGLAFENLFKGIDIATGTTGVTDQKIDASTWNIRGGHGIAGLARRTITNIKKHELDLLERLEEYVVWAGRYPIPNNAGQLVASTKPNYRRTFRSDDPALIDSLFKRLSEQLIQEWNQSGSESQ